MATDGGGGSSSERSKTSHIGKEEGKEAEDDERNGLSKPTAELMQLIDSVEGRIHAARHRHWQKQQKAALAAANANANATTTTTTNTATTRSPARKQSSERKVVPHHSSSLSLARFLKRRVSRSPSSEEISSIEELVTGTQVMMRGRKRESLAEFIPFYDADDDDDNNKTDTSTLLIEEIRRMAELCVIGENYVTNVQNEQLAYEQRRKDEWRNARDGISTSLRKMSEEEKPRVNLEKSQLFDIFLERNGMALLVEMLNGSVFSSPRPPPRTTTTTTKDHIHGTTGSTGVVTTTTYLPPIPVAIQALQSICILIQNVSRATSLYALLSNNHVNALIKLQLKWYEAAEKHRIGVQDASHYGTPAVTELTTHFVTFLKSLAMRMNAETLQFFLIFPPPPRNHNNNNNTDDHNADEEETLEFPLYECSLKLCASQNDSFVRTTALNICLNTLRLAAVQDNNNNNNADPLLDGQNGNNNKIAFAERVMIATYACVPATVVQLIAPVFGKLALHWTALDEAIRAMDENRHMNATTHRNERVVLAKEKVRRERLIRNFQEAVGHLHDELYLLDDIFKVGLTVLNEQLIEMMLATFVYPLLLQPLVIYAQHLAAAIDEDRLSFSDHPFGGISLDMSDIAKSLIPVAGPAKAALFTLSSLFQCLSNRPLLRLVVTALFHPLSPDTSKNPTLRTKLQVATIDEYGKDCIRVDRSSTTDERETYEFGTDMGDRRESSPDLATAEDDPKACMFVLSPALAEVLEFRGGEDLGLLSRTKANPYRQALLACLKVPADMADVRKLAVCTFDGALSALSNCSHILYGTDLLHTSADDDTLQDEVLMESKAVNDEHDRDLGISTGSGRSAFSFRGRDFVVEVVAALCNTVATAFRVSTSEWKLEYDEVAAHALLMATRHTPSALQATGRHLDALVRQAAMAVAAVPTSGLTPMGGTTALMPGAPDINADDFEERMFEAFLNAVFYDSIRPGRNNPITQDARQLKKFAYTSNGYTVRVSQTSDAKEVADRISKFLLQVMEVRDYFGLDDLIDERRESASVWLKLDALHNLFLDLAANGWAARDIQFSGTVLAEGDLVTIDDFRFSRSFFAGLSGKAVSFLYQPPPPPPKEFRFARADYVDLTAHLAISCVCEVSGVLSQFFTNDGIEAEGVEWHPLLLVFVDTQLVFCHPSGAEENRAKIIASCDMERLTAERDPVDNESAAAKRLSLGFKWFDLKPPPLFLFDAIPDFKEEGPFVEIYPFTSRLDVWLEHESAMRQAFTIMNHKIFGAKCVRGRRIKSFLDPNGEITVATW